MLCSVVVVTVGKVLFALARRVLHSCVTARLTMVLVSVIVLKLMVPGRGSSLRFSFTIFMIASLNLRQCSESVHDDL